MEKKHVTKIRYDVGQDKKDIWMSEWTGCERVYTQKHKRTPEVCGNVGQITLNLNTVVEVLPDKGRNVS